MDTNYNLIESLHRVLYSKNTYLDYLEENGGWYFMLNYPNHFLKYSYQLNQLFELKYKFELLPILNSSQNDDVLCLYENKYYLIHNYCELGYELKQIFSTPEEVWQKAIKPDIENYYDIKIEE